MIAKQVFHVVNCKKCKNHYINEDLVFCKIDNIPIPENGVEKFDCVEYRETEVSSTK